MKRTSAYRLPVVRLATLSMGVVTAIVTGCGSQAGETLFVTAAYPASCDDAERSGRPATDRVVIDWSGGVSALSDGVRMPGIDFAAFKLRGGGTLADVSEEFTPAVRDEVEVILCSLPEASVHVSNGEATHVGNVSNVFVLQATSPNAPGQIGEGDYDPCNVTHANEAIIFGEELLELGGPYDFDEWVRMLSNVIAHEIGHTLGYGHIDRSPVVPGERIAHVELMFAVHTVSEMIRSQRYLAPDTNCPVAGDSSADKRVLAPGFTCNITHD